MKKNAVCKRGSSLTEGECGIRNTECGIDFVTEQFSFIARI